MNNNNQKIINQLDKIKRYSKHGGEYWVARDIQVVLGYRNWDNFMRVIEKAQSACIESGEGRSNHFLDAEKMVSIGSGAKRKQADFYLSRYACYLIAMNGDSAKPEVATAQTYFAVQTRRMELQDQLTEDERRLLLRKRVTDNNKKLSHVASQAGVQNFGLFHDAGYRGLYGMGLTEIKRYKGIEGDLLDQAGRAELAANDFRITQTELKILSDNVNSEKLAIDTHRHVGETVRKTMKNMGKTLPENLPPEPSIKAIERKLKKQKKITQQ